MGGPNNRVDSGQWTASAKIGRHYIHGNVFRQYHLPSICIIMYRTAQSQSVYPCSSYPSGSSSSCLSTHHFLKLLCLLIPGEFFCIQYSACHYHCSISYCPWFV